jgi:7,8-dihydropterin-6-yl-methyl-4-(beta-D-ribofuranosyl)aminobenzene 5'-phosphate synthase
MKIILLIIVVVSLCFCNKDQKSASQKTYDEIPDNTIISLYDAFGESDKELQKDFGFSCILKYQGKTILFDGGSNADIFKSNVENLKIDLSRVDFVIASHAHFDHINGFDYLLEINPNVKIYFPFDPFWGANFKFNLVGQDPTIIDSLDQRMQYFEGDFETFMFNQTGRFWNANVEYVKANKEIAPGMKLIVTKSPYMGYFTKYPKIGWGDDMISRDENESDKTNFIQLQELSLSLKTEEGEVLIVGCSHSTVEQIINETRLYTKNDVSLVYGGYHLLPYKREELTLLANKLKNEMNVKKVAPAHCTGHLAFKVLQNTFNDDYVFAGLGSAVKFGTTHNK